MNFRPFLLVLILLSTITCAQDKNPKNKENTYELVVPDLTIPWGFAFLPDGSMLITEKKGEVIHFVNGKKNNITGLPNIYVRGQGGLMDITLHPNYTYNGWIYFSYASSEGEGNGGNTTIARAKLKNNTIINWQVLYKASPNSTRGQHFGSRLVFDDNDYLYFTIGDRGDRDINPQDITRDCGKVYRINDDGTIPKDNPFFNIPNAKKAIYSYGHRNPQGMTLHPVSKDIWTHEHGPKGGDEINVIKKGKNYGWPVISYGVNYSGTKFTDLTEKEGMEQPLHYWDPSIAPSGMAFINSNKYGDWNGKLLVGSLKFQYLNLCTLRDRKVVKEEQLLSGLGRVRSVEQGPDGYVYVGIENLGIVKLLRK
ncbi:PQQ-dependent sugar dehydrogenase [Winogradskyella alexanderae]|uniref:PQQ-dependent sugar dehydrogenase n=1 Tax=Winogradskyella alexanderae TaxID=2877123 RepID=A0ABS7XQJ7_9FLAO|nr:PQQ-dependent sugar dehydrogenase [Winogradskyella alexanderae]MCA0132273.1 PQQ-dependent sugar dehydrogenase [Winogradskyella alexanderae]